MFEVNTENADRVALLIDGAPELTADELSAVSGGMFVQIRIGNEELTVTADAKGYAVDHTHYGPV
jgi:hypothetical protein